MALFVLWQRRPTTPTCWPSPTLNLSSSSSRPISKTNNLILLPLKVRYAPFYCSFAYLTVLPLDVSAVFHVASPVILASTNPEKEIVQPAIDGVLNTFNAALANGVSTYLYTSSTVTLYHDSNIDPNYTYSHGMFRLSCAIYHDLTIFVCFTVDFESTSSPNGEGFGDAYIYSKRVAEQTVWKLAEIHKNIRVVSLLPGFTIGPYVHDNSKQTTEKLQSCTAHPIYSIHFGVLIESSCSFEIDGHVSAWWS